MGYRAVARERMWLPGFLLLACLLLGAPSLAAVQITADGQLFRVKTPVYTAVIGKNHLITSLKIGDMELLGDALTLMEQKSEKFNKLGATVKQSENTLLSLFGAELKDEAIGGDNDGPDAPSVTELAAMCTTILYTFDDQKITLKITDREKGFDTHVKWTVSPHAQLLDAAGLPLSPGLKISSPLNVTYDDGTKVALTHSGPGNPFNDWENGGFGDYSWSRRLNPGSVYTFTLAIAKGAPGARVIAAPPFKMDAPVRISHLGEPLAVNLVWKKEIFATKIADLHDTLVTYQLVDILGKVVDHGEKPVVFTDSPVVSLPITCTPSRTGWFDLQFSLNNRAHTLTPIVESLPIAVVHTTPGMPNEVPKTNDPLDWEAFLGLHCERLNIALKEIAPVDIFTEVKPRGGKTESSGGLEDSPEDTASTIMSQPQWDNLDNYVNEVEVKAKKDGVSTFWLIDSVPKWLTGQPEKMEKLLTMLFTRYKGRLHYVMLWNEPNLAMGPDGYVKNCLGPLFRAARKADPSVKVMGPDTCGLNPGWLKGVYDAGGKGMMDVIDMHPYTGHNRGWDEHDTANTWREVRALMTANGDGEKEMWSTESGFDFGAGRLGSTFQLLNVSRQYPLAESAGIPKEHFFYYYTRAMGFINFYLVDYDNHLMPAGVAARMQAEQFAGTRYAGEMSLGHFRRGFRYHGATEDVVMAYSLDFDTQTPVTITSKRIVLYDIMGNLLTDASQPTAAPKHLLLPLTGYPIYIHLDPGATITPEEKLGDNVAAAAYWKAQGKAAPTVTASSTQKGNVPEHVIDGIWNAQNQPSYDGYLWVGEKSILETHEAWVEIALPEPRRIDTAYVCAPSDYCGMTGLRAFKFQVMDGADWRTVSEVKDNDLSWIFELHFPAVTASRVRLLITDLNNGWKIEDKSPYTDMLPRVSEIELFAHP